MTIFSSIAQMQDLPPISPQKIHPTEASLFGMDEQNYGDGVLLMCRLVPGILIH